ncbi:MAG: metallophosphoesterase family protein [Sedimentisphaerales bacterium]
MYRGKLLVLLLVLCIAMPGCSESGTSERIGPRRVEVGPAGNGLYETPTAKLPPPSEAVLRWAKIIAPHTKVTKWEVKNGSYRLNAEVGQEEYQFDVTPEGKLLELEYENDATDIEEEPDELVLRGTKKSIAISKVPEALLETLAKAVPGVKPSQSWTAETIAGSRYVIVIDEMVFYARPDGQIQAAGLISEGALEEIDAPSLRKVFSAADDTSPERIFLTLTAQPATSQAVSWRARPTSNMAQAQVIPAPGGPIKDKTPTTVKAIVERIIYQGGQTMFFAVAEFKGLQPSTLYAYRVGDGKTWSEWNHFRTADAKAAPFRFIYIGDQQNDIKSQWSRVIREAVLKAPDARFIAQAGDLVSDPFDDQMWYEWYDGAGWIYRVIPSLPTPGNHDVGDDGADKVWRPQFILPLNGPVGQEELSYFVDYQGVRLMCLNGNAFDNEAQLEWLEKVLADNPCAWTIVLTHQPLYSTGKERDSSNRRNLLMPIFDKYGVDLVLQGHDHSYGRTPKICAGQIVKPEEPGIIYVVSVSGPKMYTLKRENRPLMARMAANLQLFQVVSVNDVSLNYDAYTADSKLFDSFELEKTGPKATKLIDRAPKDENPREEDFFIKSERQ